MKLLFKTVKPTKLRFKIILIQYPPLSLLNCVNEESKPSRELTKKIPSDSGISFEERVVRNAEDTIEIAQEFSQCNLFLVGRTPEGPVTEKLNGKSECPEFGSANSLLLTSPEFSTSASVLVLVHAAA
ncbi:hypothetical protein SLE2022_229740 [Rubroshorea leprosula]